MIINFVVWHLFYNSILHCRELMDRSYERSKSLSEHSPLLRDSSTLMINKRAATPTLPRGSIFTWAVVCILFTELCERLTFYGINGNLVLFATESDHLNLSPSSASILTNIFQGIALLYSFHYPSITITSTIFLTASTLTTSNVSAIITTISTIITISIIISTIIITINSTIINTIISTIITTIITIISTIIIIISSIISLYSPTSPVPSPSSAPFTISVMITSTINNIFFQMIV